MITANEAWALASTPAVQPEQPDEALMLAVTMVFDANMAAAVVDHILEVIQHYANYKKYSCTSLWPLDQIEYFFCSLPKARKDRFKDMVVGKLKKLGYVVKFEPAYSDRSSARNIPPMSRTDGKTHKLEISWN